MTLPYVACRCTGCTSCDGRPCARFADEDRPGRWAVFYGSERAGCEGCVVYGIPDRLASDLDVLNAAAHVALGGAP